MLKSCPYCGGLHPLGHECSKKRKRYPPKQTRAADRFRSSYRWQRFREQIGARDRHLCILCLLEGVITMEGIEVHHIIPLEEDIGRALDGRNVISLCQRHHKAADAGKIARTILQRLAGILDAGTPPGVGMLGGEDVETPTQLGHTHKIP